MTTPTISDFVAKLNTMLSKAENKRLPAITISTGELHREVGGYPGDDHRMPVCCNAMRKVMQEDIGDVIIKEPPSGQGASLTIKYKLPRG